MFEFNDNEVLIVGGSGPIGLALQELIPCADAPDHSELDFTDWDRWELQSDFEEWIRNKKIVFNLLGYTTNMHGNIRWAEEVFHDNVIMNMNLLSLCVDSGVEKVVNIIPSCAYPDEEFLSEDMFWQGKCHDSIESHGMARRNQLMYCRQIFKQHGLRYVCAVANNVIGPHDSIDTEKTKFAMGVIVRMIAARDNGEPTFSVWGTGQVKRSLVFSEDVADGLIQVARHYDDPMEPINIASDEEFSVLEYVQMVKEVVNYGGEIITDPSKPDGQMRKQLSTTKMKDVLKWEPSVGIMEAIERTVDWYEENHGK